MDGLEEVMEFDLAEWVFPEEAERRLREQMPPGLDVRSVAVADPHRAALGAEVTYRIAPKEAAPVRLTPDSAQEVMARDEISVRRIRKGRQKVVNIRPFILSANCEGDALVVRVKAGPDGSTRPEEVLSTLGLDGETCRTAYRVTRTRVKLVE